MLQHPAHWYLYALGFCKEEDSDSIAEMGYKANKRQVPPNRPLKLVCYLARKIDFNIFFTSHDVSANLNLLPESEKKNLRKISVQRK